MRLFTRAALAATVLGMALMGLCTAPTEARVVFGVGVGVPLYYPPPVYYPPPPVYYAPPPVVYQAPAPVVVPAPTMQQNSAAQNWYYCDASRAYYPHVTSCASGWREVAPQATR